MSDSTPAIVIADYNLTRTDDVRLLTAYAARRYGCSSILIRSKPAAVDRQLADVVIDLDPLAPDFPAAAARALTPYRSRIRAVLPFSDNGVQSGAALAELLGLPHDSATLAQAAFSKEDYRRHEWTMREYLRAQGLMVPRSQAVQSLEELRTFAGEMPNGFVLKPSCEGNNRGVLKLMPGDDLERAFAEVMPYLQGGLIVEELIPFEEEYSFDGIGHLSFVTKKASVTGRYPVERGQTVPAREKPSTLATIRRGGTLANVLCGQRIGPFHHEVKYDPGSGQGAVIEPNRRPAGMRIWHLAERVYRLNFFELWMDQLLTGKLPQTLPAPHGVAAIRMLAAPRDGTLHYEGERQDFGRQLMSRTQREWEARAGEARGPIEWFDFQLHAASGTRVRAEPLDNSHFIAHVCLYSPDGGLDEQRVFDSFEHVWSRVISEHIS
jgi:hypothetical protein